jgi:glycosyltransferase involved in cell wall biosynthesis
MKVSICIPCYNEEDTIANVIVDCFISYPKAEVIIVNDASTDKTLEILEKLKYVHPGLKILTNRKNSGHAYSVVKGLKAAKGDYVIYMDADNQIHLSDINIEGTSDGLISGYRVHRQDKLFRKVVSFILKMTILLRHGLWIKDANCPLKIFEKETLQDLLSQLPTNSIVPSICLEILARRYTFNIIEIPVKHHPYIKERKGSLQSINKKSLLMFWKAFKEVWKI